MLQRLMSAGLLENVEDDDMFRALQAASESLTLGFTGYPPSVISATLVALNPDVSVSEAMLVSAEHEVEKGWKTFRGRYKDRPRTILRAVILDALRRAADTDESIAYAVAQTAATVLPSVTLGGELQIVVDVIDAIAAIAEAAARTRFSTPASEPDAEDTPPAAAPDIRLVGRVASALGPQAAIPGVTLTEPNPHWSNDPTNWTVNAAPRLAAIFSEVTRNAVSSALARVRSTGHQASGLDLQVRLLGWSHALFSPSLNYSYRELPKNIAAFAMAIDAHELVGSPCPESVGYMVAEAARRISAEDRESATNFVTSITSNPMTKRLLKSTPLPSGQKNLLHIIGQVLAGVPLSSISLAIGVDLDRVASQAEFAHWIFRELQAHSAVSQ